ncbi:lipopolysaccharide transport periplasmic protein LptA, partial [Acinetobacter baumannii]|uniref:lipopolysaccharide transport periplasmic protein LptA n=1 Tax=Acinetobacter baumannii TaxID=470 RepID=UPI001D1759B6
DVEVFTSIGKPAYYEQKPAVDKEIVKAYGLTIQYFAANERIVLLDQAKVVQEGNTFEGEKIVYDTRRQIVNAGRATNTDVSTPRPRVDMVIQPLDVEVFTSIGKPAYYEQKPAVDKEIVKAYGLTI